MLPAATGNVPGLRRDFMKICSLKSKLRNLRRICGNEVAKPDPAIDVSKPDPQRDRTMLVKVRRLERTAESNY